MSERISERLLYARLSQQKHSLDYFDAAKRLVFRASDDSSFAEDFNSYLENYAFRVVRHVGDFFTLLELKTPSGLLASALVSDLVNRGICTYDEVELEFRKEFRKLLGSRSDTLKDLEEVIGDFTRMCLRGASLPPPFIDYSKNMPLYQSRVSLQLKRLESEGIEPCAIALSNAVVLAQNIVDNCEIDGSLSSKTKIVYDYLSFAKKFDLKYFFSELEKPYNILNNTLAVELKSPGSFSDLEGIDLNHL